MDILTRVENATVPIGTFVDLDEDGDSKGKMKTGVMVEHEGGTAIMTAAHMDVDWTTFLLGPPSEPSEEPKRWARCRPLARSLDRETLLLAAPDGLNAPALPIEDMYAPDPPRGTTVRALTYNANKAEWLPQLREGIVSAPSDGTSLRAELTAFGAGSGAMAWTEEGLVGTLQEITRFQQRNHRTGPHEEHADVAGVAHSGLTRVRDLKTQLQLLSQL
jgi:hypothetical protein